LKEEFVNHLKILVPRLLAPENLIVKEIGGEAIKARDLIHFFTLYMKVFKNNNLPEQPHLLSLQHWYTWKLNTTKPRTMPQVYLEKNIYGRKNQAVAEKYQTLLHEQIEKLYLQYSQNNEAKEITHMARTPGTLFVVFFFFYMISGVFGLFGMKLIAYLCDLIMAAFLLMFAVWVYVRYSGNYRDVETYIDELATCLWENVLHPIYQICLVRHLKEAAKETAQQAITRTVTNKKHKKR
ncbi:hypothetical protein Pmani_035721, partial [Petrolisthes manimaculis]